MNRRDTLLALLALGVTPIIGHTQLAPVRIAIVALGKATPEPGDHSSPWLVDALRRVGLTDGKDYIFEYFSAKGDNQRFPALLESVVERRPLLILVFSVAATRAAQRATKTIPILMVRINDPVGNGLIESLAHPGGNTTGFAGATAHVPKMAEFVRQVFPKAKRLGVLTNPLNLSSQGIFDSLQRAAASAGMTTESFKADAPERIGNAFSAMAKTRPDVIYVMPDSMLLDQSAQITALSIARKIPVIASTAVQADEGALFGYGALANAMDYRIEDYIKKLLVGVKPADLPVVQPSTFELVINLKTAKELGIKIPPAFLLRADRVIR